MSPEHHSWVLWHVPNTSTSARTIATSWWFWWRHKD